MYYETGLPWVLPSPNMPTPQTATVYPGTVLAEALNISEGRGTVIPFELTGAPWIDGRRLLDEMRSRKLPGCQFRMHDFIPTFHKYAGEYCRGIQIHITDASVFKPVATAMHLFDAIIRTSPEGSLKFNPPPYEYEYRLMPFDILSGDSRMRGSLKRQGLRQADADRGLPTGLAPHTYAYVKKIQALSCFFLDSRRFGVNLPTSAEFKALPSDIDLPVLDNGN